MTIKLGNLADWRILEGASIAFTSPDYDKTRSRRLRLDLNSEFECNWYIRFHRIPILNMPEYEIGHEAKLGEPIAYERFFAVIPAGLQTVEFTVAGDFELLPIRQDECEIQFWTTEAEEYWTEGDGQTFSTIHERQPRNPDLEWVQFQALQNQLRRDKAHADELAAIRAEIGAMNNGGTGVHGQPATEHKEPKSGGAKAAGKQPPSSKQGEAGGDPPGPVVQPDEGGNGPAKGEAAKGAQG